MKKYKIAVAGTGYVGLSIEKPKIYFFGKVYCRREMDMITAFF